MRWLKYVLYKTGNWTPFKLSDKIGILLIDKINVYEYSSRVTVHNSNIIKSITLIEELLQPDFNNEYVIKTNHGVHIPMVMFIHRWYSDDMTLLDNDIFIKWLRLINKLNKKYERGIKKDKTTLAYRNSIKIKFIIEESSNIVNAMFK